MFCVCPLLLLWPSSWHKELNGGNIYLGLRFQRFQSVFSCFQESIIGRGEWPRKAAQFTAAERQREGAKAREEGYEDKTPTSKTYIASLTSAAS